MLVTPQDVRDYWTRYCERHQLASEILELGLKEIAINHEYWSDHPMPELKELVLKRLKGS
jgi:hypothetical protein